MLSNEEITMVQSDWEKVVPIADQATTMFYQRLFEIDPGVKPLFSSDLAEQRMKLAAMLTTAVRGLGNLEALVPAVQGLGKRHVGYGVKPEHYASVGAALIWTLQQGLGDGFDAEHEAAWTKVYGVLSKTMIDAAA